MMRIRPARPVLLGLVVLAAVGAYVNSLANGFAYDDVPIISDDARVHGLGQLAAIFTQPYWAGYSKALGLYRPLTTLSLAFQWALGGGAPWVFHFGNILLHAAVCVVLFLVLERLAGRAAAFVGALVFAVHPVHTEAVANVVGQAELLAALGVLVAGWLWLRRARDESPRAATVAAVAAAYAFALFAKEGAVLAPALLVALDLADGRVRLSRAGVAEYARSIAPLVAALGVVAALFLGARHVVLGSLAGGEPAPAMPFLVHDHFWMGLRVWPEYARLLVFPQDLSADYSPAVILPVHGWTLQTALGAMLCAAVVVLALATAWRPGVGLPAAWFLLSILVVSNLFFPIGVVLAERTLYLPSAALAVALAFAWGPLRERYGARPVTVVAVVAMLALGARTWVRNPDWRDQDTVVRSILRDHPESGRAQWLAAHFLFERGDTLGADAAWTLANRLWPDNPPLLFEFASYYITRRHPADALPLLQRAIALRPGDLRNQELLASALIDLGRHREALATADRLLPLLPGAPAVNDLRARAYMGLRDCAGASAAWGHVVRAYYATWGQWSGLARSRAACGDSAGAVIALDSARLHARGDTVALRRIEQLRTSIRASGPGAM